jgi:hypothetical protein
MHQHQHQHRDGGTGRPAGENRGRRAASPVAAGGAHAAEGHGAGDAASAMALQRAVGNHGAGRILTAQRMMQAPAQGQAAGQNQAAPVTLSEVQQLQAYRATTANPAVRTLLDELIPLLQRVATWTPTQGTGGGHTHNQGPAQPGGPNQYRIHYANQGTDSERVAVLVHELTHVAVNESYDSDMLNYPVAPLPAGANAANEAERQTARLGATNQNQLGAFQAHAIRNAAELLELLPQAGFGPPRMREAAEKLAGHTAQNPLHEYDAVLSHLLVWADRDGIPRGTQFYQRLTAMVTEAAGWRHAGLITPTAAAGTLDAERARALAARNAIPAPPRAPAATGPAATGSAATGSAAADRRRGHDLINRLAQRFARRDGA